MHPQANALELSPVLKRQVDVLSEALRNQPPLPQDQRYGFAYTTEAYASVDVMQELMAIYCARQIGEQLNAARTVVRTYLDGNNVMHVMEVFT
jgi:hypothetical protein